LYLVLIGLENYFNPEYWKANNEPSVFSEIIVLLTFITSPLLAPKYLNEHDSRKSIMKINIQSGLNLFIIVMLFILFQSLIIHGKRGGDLPISIVTMPFKMSILGMAISNIRIRALRKLNLARPIIVSVLVMILTIWILF